MSACGKPANNSNAPSAAPPASVTPPVSSPVAAPTPSVAPSGGSHTIAAHTPITVISQSVADSSLPAYGFLAGVIADDVKGADGKVAIPAGATVVMAIRGSGKNGPVSHMDVGLYSVNINGTQFRLSDGKKDPATISFTEDAGKGPSHAAVHIQYGLRLEFHLEVPVQLQ